jgi:hypothetical protein
LFRVGMRHIEEERTARTRQLVSCCEQIRMMHEPEFS